MRRPSLALATIALLSAPAVTLAQPSPAAPQASPPSGAATTPAPAPAPTPAPTTVIAKVGSDTIHYSDLQDALQSLPEQLRAMPPNMLYPMLLDQLIDREVIVQQAKKDKLQDDPKVQHAIQQATNMALQNALLTREIQPSLTPEAIKAQYDKEYAGKSGEEQVHAEHILVPTEAKAKDIIAQLDKGADFATLAKENSTDPSAKENSGDLGWFKKGDMLPEFSDAAFALKPGQITQTPVHTRFGWHVIKVEGTRTAPPPTLDEVRDEMRQQIIQEGVAKVLASAKQGVTIEKFNADGTPYTPPAGMPGSPAPSK
ncbi:MAG: peptidylprolyl isomerase [Acetobacteraceae bacterium]|nr:peptidylprolyl isomerase [Acetobacteraceae bacterium]